MVTRLLSGSLWGVEGHPVTVEVDVAKGLPAFDIVGLAGPAVREARERVRAGLKNAGFEFPLARITVNLAPADLRKQGTGFDLAMALGILHRTGQIKGGRWQQLALVAELSLDGTLHPLRGLLPILYHLTRQHAEGAVVAAAAAGAAKRLPGVEIVGAGDLAALGRWINLGCPTDRGPAGGVVVAGGTTVSPDDVRGDGGTLGGGAVGSQGHGPTGGDHQAHDLRDLEGQQHARRALEIAAAGGHNVLLIGPPGTGKSTLARCLPGILPPPDEDEALEILMIYSAAGEPPPSDAPGRIQRPYRAPHHTIPPTAMVGGGTIPEPGEVSLAHRGILFLDELAHFNRRSLEALREPLAEGFITVTRLYGASRLPAAVGLVAAMNPCPCGFRHDLNQPCRCTDLALRRYWATLSGPILDRIDMHVPVIRPTVTEVFQGGAAETSAAVAARVAAARQLQRFRLKADGLQCNAEMGRRHLDQFCRPDAEGRLLLQEAYQQTGLTMRGYVGALKLARTIADLAGSQTIDGAHVAQALALRRLDHGQAW